MRAKGGIAVSIVALFGTLAWAAAAPGQTLTPSQQLGRSIYFDANLSINLNQACADCHAPETGFTGPSGDVNAHGAVYEGSVPGMFGNRKPPSAAYATPSPILYVSHAGAFTGGNFWDGRATGEKLGSPAADQAQGPFLNPREQGLPDSACVVYRVCNPVVPADYPVTFEDVWGAGACAIPWPEGLDAACGTAGSTLELPAGVRAAIEEAFDRVALSIAAYEASAEVNAFSSLYDASFGGKAVLGRQAQDGYALFRGKANCHRCHVGDGRNALFTAYAYDNLGVPVNPENPVYDWDPGFVDQGLGAFLATRTDYQGYAAANMGREKIPTLRNVATGACEAGYEPCVTKAYGHNGYFKSLRAFVHFLNTRDVLPACPGPYTEAEALQAFCWPVPEVAATVNRTDVGDLGLTPAEERAMVAFLATLSDGTAP